MATNDGSIILTAKFIVESFVPTGNVQFLKLEVSWHVAQWRTFWDALMMACSTQEFLKIDKLNSLLEGVVARTLQGMQLTRQL